MWVCCPVLLIRKCLSCPIWMIYICHWWHLGWTTHLHPVILQSIPHPTSPPWSPRSTCQSNATLEPQMGYSWCKHGHNAAIVVKPVMDSAAAGLSVNPVCSLKPVQDEMCPEGTLSTAVIWRLWGWCYSAPYFKENWTVPLLAAMREH